MKATLKIIFGMMTLLFMGVSHAQFNYAALVKDSNGNPIVSQNIPLRISILDESQNVDYQETHTVTSTADGVVSLVIGNGTVVSGIFAELDWSQTFYIKDEIDFGNGYITMGIEAIKPVPLASYALNSVSATIRPDASGNLMLVDEVPALSANDSITYGQNIALGENAMHDATTTFSNIAIGEGTLSRISTAFGNNSAGLNVAIGGGSLESLTDGWVNQAIGSTALHNLTSGTANVAIGSGALEDLVEGEGNVAIGLDAIHQPTATGTVTTMENRDIKTSSYNTAVGYRAMYANTGASYNTAVGDEALFNVSSNANANVAMGSSSLRNNGVGWSNTAIGANALKNNTNSDRNTAVGSGAGQSIVNGDRLVFLGASSDVSSGTDHIQNSIVIGFGATVSTSNTVQLGNNNIEHVLTNGTISATAFVGDGSGLTNLTISGTLSPDANGNITIGDSNLLNRNVNENSIALGNQALSNVRNTHPSWGGSDMPSSTLDESIFGVPGNIGIGAGAYASPQTSTSTFTENAIGNVTIGHMSMYNAAKSTSANIALGTFTLPVIEEGGGNITMGWNGLLSLIKGSGNIAIGQNNMEKSLEGNMNVSLGHSAMYNSTYSDKNTALGNFALRNLGSTLDRLYSWTEDGEIYSNMNTAVGHAPLYTITEGNFNTAVGALSLYNLASGYRNVALGFHTYYNLQGGDLNTALGDGAGYETTGVVSQTTLIGASTRIDSGVVNSTAIGYAANVTTSNTIQLGDNNIERVNTSGVVSATAFIGDGSGLTNLTVSSTITPDQNGNLILSNSSYQGSSTVEEAVGVGKDVFLNSTLYRKSVAIGTGAMKNAFNRESYAYTASDDPNTDIDEAEEWNVSGSVAVGYEALQGSATSSNTGNWNTAIGYQSQKSNSTGRYNASLGGGSLQNNTTGGYNTAVGDWTLNENTTAWYNTALGALALARNTGSGRSNVAVGAQALYSNTTGYRNTAVGSFALNTISESNHNTAIGYKSGKINTENSNYNVLVGAYANTVSGTAVTNAIALGANAIVTASNTIQLGDTNIQLVNTSGVVSATAFIGDGSALTNLNLSGVSPDADGNVLIVNNPPSLVASATTNYTHISNSGNNIALGNNALEDGTTTTANIAIGANTLKEITTKDSGLNVAIGDNAMSSLTTGFVNVAIGSTALQEAENASVNIAIGAGALEDFVSGEGNIAIGLDALHFLTGTGTTTSGDFGYPASSENTAIGHNAMKNNTGGSYNVALGANALFNVDVGFNNTALGMYGLQSNYAGVGNTSVGWGALMNSRDNYGNTAVGSAAGQNLDTQNSSNNTFIGTNADTVSGTAINNAVAIGASSFVSSDNTVVLGNNQSEKWAFGLTTTDSGKAIQVGSSSSNGNGAYLTAGGVWTDASSILFKTNFIDLDNDWIKSQIAKLKIRRWDYKETDETHIGPTAEEFIDLFSVGIESDKQHLSTLDVAGVALKGVQAVIEENQELKEQNAALEQQYEDLKELLTQVLERVEKLEQ